MNQFIRGNKKILPSLIAALIASGAQAQDAVEEIVVTGVRAAQEKAIDIKRNSSTIVDSISAEDIGKLPDATIADSLQRVTGVQIQRSAGQGALVSIRGSSEVLTTLNGELFLTAENILNSQADFRDVPSALIVGSNVSKSMNATQLEGGIGGSIDLLTGRALKLDDGLSGSVRVQAVNGSITEKTNPELSGLLGLKWSDDAAMSLAYSYTDETVSDQSIDTAAGHDVQDDSSWAGNKDFNGNGQNWDRYLIMSDWNGPELYKNDTDRKRLGLAYNFNTRFNDAFELNVDSFYNSMQESAAGNYLYLSSELNDYDRSRITELYGINSVNQPDDVTQMSSQYYATGWTREVGAINGNGAGLRGGVKGSDRDTMAINNSVELKFDNGGAFTGTLRYINSKASRKTSDLTLGQKTSSPGGDDGLAYDVAGDTAVVNPGYIQADLTDPYTVTFLANRDDVKVTFDDRLAALSANPAAWYVHSSWLEGERQDVSLDVLRADGSFKLNDQGLTSIDFGLRASDRTAKRSQYHYFMPTGITAYDPSTCNADNVCDEYQMLVKYHEAGYVLNNVANGRAWNYRIQTGASKDPVNDPTINFEPVRGINLDEAAVSPYLTNVTDFGALVNGMNNVSIPMFDVGKIGNQLSFLNQLYGVEHVKRERPQRSYKIDQARSSVYVNANFNSDLADGVNLSGTAGVRFVKDDITVTRNLIDGSMLDADIIAGPDVNHSNFQDLGDVTTLVTNNYMLPSLNLNIAFADSYKLRFAYDKRTSLQSLNNFGEGQDVSYASQRTDEDTGSVYQPIDTVKEGGNPYLKPWSADAYNLGAEWYPSDNALLAATFFYLDIGGFTETEKNHITMADSDGVVRNGATLERLVNSKNASVKGLELSYQQSFDFLPSFLSNTGITWNYTYSPSKKEGSLAFDGSELPFNQTAKNQSNLVLWYNDDSLEFRIAANYLGKKYDGTYSNWTTDPDGGLAIWDAPTLYIDLSSTYHINEDINVSLNVQNLTEESTTQYLQWEKFRSQYHAYERRITLGVNARF